MIGNYLLFNRNCEEAVKVYGEAFGAKVLEIQKYGEMPPDPSFPVPEGDKNLVLHARLAIGGEEIMCADSSRQINSGENMYVSITTKDEALVKKAWDILAPNGEIYMELASSFFSSLHGSLRDKFGINWMFTALK